MISDEEKDQVASFEVSKSKHKNQKSLKKHSSLYARCCLIMDFIVSVKGKVTLLVLLFAGGFGMFVISTTENSPELREFTFNLDDETSCAKDTINKFIMQVMLDPCFTGNSPAYTQDQRIDGLLRIDLSYRTLETKAKDRYYIENDSMNLYGKTFIMQLQGYQMSDSNFYDLKNHVMCYCNNNIVRIAKETPDHTLSMGYRLDNIGKYLLPSDVNNPFIMTYFNFDFKRDIIDLNAHTEKDTAFSSKIYIQTSPEEVNFENRLSPLNIISVWPTPDHVGPDGIIFSSKESIETALANGIFISAEDLTKKQVSDRRIFFYTLLLGVIVSWLITLAVSLILHFHKYLHQIKND